MPPLALINDHILPCLLDQQKTSESRKATFKDQQNVYLYSMMLHQ